MRSIERNGNAVAVILAVSSASALGQWVEQSFDLTAGWNTVHLEVDPSPAVAHELFGDLPIEAVWTEVESRWRVWVPGDESVLAVRNLRAIRGGRVYLIRASQATTLTVVGRPNSVETSYRPGFNVVGFHVFGPGESGPAPPTVAQYLAASPVHADTEVFELNAGGTLQEIPGATQIVPGRGYWVKAAASAIYDGPVSIDSHSRRGVDFGTNIGRHALTLQNLCPAANDVAVAYQSSTAFPSDPTGLPANAGDVPLRWLDYGGGSDVNDLFQWRPLASEVFTLDAAAERGARKVVTLSARRAGLPGATLDPVDDGQVSQYQGLVLVSSANGFRRWLPVGAQATLPAAAQATMAGAAPAAATSSGVVARPGLYLGTVTVNQVQWVTAGAPTWSNPEDYDCGCLKGQCSGGPNNGQPCDSTEDCQCPDPEIVLEMECFGGDNDGAACLPDRNRCVVNADDEDELVTNALCLEDADCCDPAGECPYPNGTCVTITDCPGGECHAYCIPGGNACPCGEGEMCSTDSDTTSLRPTPAEFNFPIIVHYGKDGTYRFLTEVAMLVEKLDTRVCYGGGSHGNSCIDDLDCPDGVCVAHRFVLATPACDPALCGPLVGGSVVDGEPFARRMSTMAFACDHYCQGGEKDGACCSSDDHCPGGTCAAKDLQLSGGGFDSQLVGTILMPADHRLNPFKHAYHPDHDVIDASTGDPSPGESIAFTRTFMLEFLNYHCAGGPNNGNPCDPGGTGCPEGSCEVGPPAGVPAEGWGDSTLGGTYSETITDVYRDDIKVGGSFILHRVSQIDALNDVSS